MIKLHNESLAKYTTFRIGGIAREMYFPESLDDLITIPNLAESWIIGAGSNLLINDKGSFGCVVCTARLNKKITLLENGNFFIGAGNRIQNAIAAINKAGYGGLEYLVSIPATIGGAIYMNAGVFSPKTTTISDYLVSVSVFEDGCIKVLKREECFFSKRYSVFHKKRAVILGAEFNFPKQSEEISKRKIAERKAIAKNQDHSGGNCGSVFKVCSYKIVKMIRFFHPSRGGATWSPKTTNWIINKGHATYKDVKTLINLSKILHKICFRKCEQEVIEWM